MPDGQSFKKPAVHEPAFHQHGYVLRTLVPLLEFLLVEVGCFLEVGELLLGELALAVVVHDQRVVLQTDVLDRAPRSQVLLERHNGIGQGEPLRGLVAREAGLVMVGQVGVVLARKLERWVLILQQRHPALAQWYMVRWRAMVAALSFGRHVCVAVSRAEGGCGEDEARPGYDEALGCSCLCCLVAQWMRVAQ
jgi:hypothetical protein